MKLYKITSAVLFLVAVIAVIALLNNGILTSDGEETTAEATEGPVETSDEATEKITEPETETEPVTETEPATETETETEPVTEPCVHVWNEEVVQAPTCTEKGVGIRICTVCGAEEEYQISAGHTYEVGIVPDEQGKVIQTKTCTVCGRVEKKEITSYTTYLGEEDGITRDKVIAWLSSHENDEYYLGTPYKGHAYAFPNGAPNYSELTDEEKAAAVEAAGIYVESNLNGRYRHKTGVPGMNCTGLIGHIMCSVSPSFKDTFDALVSDIDYLGFGMSVLTPQDSITNAWLWYVIVSRNGNRSHNQIYDRMGKFVCYKFSDREKMMNSGLLTKGDIVIAVPQATHQDMHLGVFWGDDPYDDVFWVSEKNGCELKEMRNPGTKKQTTYWYIVPLADGEWERPAENTDDLTEETEEIGTE